VTGYFPQSIVAGDFNGDGIPDLATANDGGVSVLAGNGDGTFTTPTVNAPSGVELSALAVADFNGDGKLDLALTTSEDSVWILLGNGDGTFTAASTFDDPATEDGVLSITACGFYGNGVSDLAVINYSQQQCDSAHGGATNRSSYDFRAHAAPGLEHGLCGG
jgi:hypothetical protein